MKYKIKEEDTINIDAAFKDKVTAFGNGAKVSIPKKYLGRDVIVFVVKQ